MVSSGPVFLIQEPGVRKDDQDITEAGIASRGKCKVLRLGQA